MNQLAVEINDLSVKLGQVEVFNEASFSANYGEVTGLIGPNGSGKSVLFKVISGLMKTKAKKILVNDKNLLDTTEFPPKIGTLIEEPYFLDDMSGIDNLMLLASINNNDDRQKITELMKKFDLPTDSRAVKHYSLGMKKKLGIVQAFMEQQTLVLLDEPMNALDEDSVDMVRELIKDLAQKENRAVILTSHNSEDITSLSNRVYKINKQKINLVK